MKIAHLLLVGCSAALASAHAAPLTTDIAGSGLPFNNLQPSLVVTEALPLQGLFPNRDTGFANGGTLGFVYQFGGNFAPGGSLNAQGQVMPIAQNTALFSLLGTTYGGNGQTTFAAPNLAGRAIVGTGTGSGLSGQSLGVATGSSTVSLTTSQLPAHTHSLAGGGSTGTTGGSQPFNNIQPSLPLRRLIATEGIFPMPNSGGGSASFVGQVATFAGNFTPGGWMEADGSLLSIAQNTALFSILGTTYGGNGQTTFALPDLRGRVSIGADNDHPLGMTLGAETTTLTTAQMPAHDHAVQGSANTGNTGGSAPVDNIQPSLALNYLIALQGIFPPRDGGGGFDADTPFLGQIVEFAGAYAPSGWAFARGQLLQIAQNQALFALLGTMYGGDGMTTFALPDLRGRTTIGAGHGADGIDYFVGDVFGSESNTLAVANLAAHTHTLPETGSVPEPATLVLLGLGMAGLGLGRRRKSPLV